MKNENYKKNILDLFSLIDNIEGDVIEVGTYTGDTTEIIAEYLVRQNINKHYFGLDTFKGYIEEDMTGANQASISNHQSKRWHTSLEEVKNRLKKYDKVVSLHKGDCKLIIKNLIKEKKINKLSFIYIDCNLYIPSLKSMKVLWPHLSKGGIMAIDEHLVGGETQAIKDFALSNNLDLNYYSDKSGPSYYIIK